VHPTAEHGFIDNLPVTLKPGLLSRLLGCSKRLIVVYPVKVSFLDRKIGAASCARSKWFWHTNSPWISLRKRGTA
jgi:hypothetical protein